MRVRVKSSFTAVLKILLLSPLQEVEGEFNIPVLSIVKLRHLIQFLKSTAIHNTAAAAFDWNEIDAYRIRYGVDY